jgi:dGTPase
LPDESRRYFTIRTIIDMQLTDVITTSEQLITSARVQSADEVRRHPKALIQYSPERGQLNRELRRYLYKNLYYHPAVNQPHIHARHLLRDLFNYYLGHPKEIGEQTRQGLRKPGRHRIVCDHIACMTDRYLIAEHQRLLGTQ